MRPLPTGLQDRHIRVQIDPFQALDIQDHMPAQDVVTVTIRCAITPACAYRGAGATPEDSLGPVPSHPATCTGALSPQQPWRSEAGLAGTAAAIR
jgi:hypothetical protein